MLKNYWKSRKWAALLAAVCGLLILAVYGLYGLQWGPAVYTLLVLGAVLLTAAAVDYTAYRRRMEEVTLLERRAGQFLGPLPEVRDPLEARYLALTAAVERRRREELSAAGGAAAKAREYYTLWSHQIKTPIAAMTLLLRDPQPDRQAMELELLKIGQYVDMVLQYQRLESAENDLMFRRHDMDSLVRRAVRQVSPLFIGRRVKLELGALHREVLTDEKWLVFVLEQLLTNAVKYTPADGTVRVYFTDGPCTLAVEDTGIGIRPEDLPRVFEWGYTGAAGRMERRATGIGLALCRKSMDMLGHGIRLESEAGKGTRVLLELSRAKLLLE